MKSALRCLKAVFSTGFCSRQFVNSPGLPRQMLLLLCVASLMARDVQAQSNILAKSQADLKRLSLEELLQVEVTSASRIPEPLQEVASSIRVITQEDIRRSGASSIPQALRLASNLHVAQRNSHDWAITARGFNGSAANKLLVMIDGRAVYTPLFSGVFWDVQDTLMEDIDRIEVVSGPGATLWGANAVNGVINIVTKKAGDPTAQGLLLSGGGGTEERGFGAVRYGGKAGEDVHYRAYVKFFDRDSSIRRDGQGANDDWHITQGGFRLDWEPTTESLFTLQGDAYGGDIGQFGGDDIGVDGGNVLARWSRTFSADSDLQVQFYYDRTHRKVPGTFAEDLDTYDVDFQHRFLLGQRHEFIWGGGYRLTVNDVDNSAILAFLPEKLERNLFTGFVQDKITLMEDRLYFTLGSKFEHNDYTGFEVQPSARLAWLLSERQTLWSAVSRAVRTPSRIDRHLYAPGAPTFFLAGGPDFDSEEVIAYEVGYRVQPHQRLSLSAAAFYNVYDDLRSVEPGPPFTIQNGLEGDAYGLEMDFSWQALDWWRWRGGYMYFRKNIDLKSSSADVNRGRSEGSDPRHQFQIRSLMDLPHNFELDAAVRYVDRLDNVSGGLTGTLTRGTVPSYTELEVRLGWNPRPNLEFAIVGQNLLDKRHPEFGPPGPARSEIQRSVFARVTCRF